MSSWWKKPVDDGPDGVYRPASALGPDPRVTRSARGMGKPGHEPDGPGKTKAAPAVRDDADAGSGAAWTDGTRTMEACRGQTA
jgi:hypothetical protein